MSQILQATTAFANLLIANPANLRLLYSSQYGQPRSPTQPLNPQETDILVAAGSAVTPFINAGGRALQSLPVYTNPALPLNARSWRLQVPAAQGVINVLGIFRDIELGENLEVTVSDPKDLLASGFFTPFTPTTTVPIPSVYG